MTRSSARNENGVGIHFRPARGLSLLEVVLAMAILAASVAVLSQLVGLGLRAAGQSRDLTQAQILAESLMSEISAGITAAEPLGPTQIEPGWYGSIYMQPTVHQGIVQLVVRVEQDSTSPRAAHFELSRWMRDPTLEIPVESTSDSSSSSESSTPSDSGNAGQPNDQTPGDENGPPDSGGVPNNGGRPDGRGDGAGRGGRGGGDAGPGQGGGRGGRGGGNAGPGQGSGRGGRGGDAGPGQGGGRGGRGGGNAGPGQGGGAPGGQGQPGRGAGAGGGPAGGGGSRR